MTKFHSSNIARLPCLFVLWFFVGCSHSYRTNDWQPVPSTRTADDDNSQQFLIWIDTNTAITNEDAQLSQEDDNTTTTVIIPIRSAVAQVDVTNTGMALDEAMSITVMGGLGVPSSTMPILRNSNNPLYNGTLIAAEQWLRFEKTRAYTNSRGHWIWQGMVPLEVGFGYATFIENVDGCIAGSFTSNHSAFTMTCLPDGTVRVDQIQWQDFPQQNNSIPLMAEEANAADFYYEDDGIIMNPSYEEFIAVLNDVATMTDEDIIEADSDNSSIPDVNSTWATGQIISDFFLPPKSPATVLDVLVIVTNTAMCQQAGRPAGCLASDYKQPIEDALAVAEAQTTSAMQDVNVNAAIRIVKIHHDTTGYDVQLFSDDKGKVSVLDDLVKPLDKKLGYVRQMRKNVGADLVTLVSTVGNICGVGAPGPFSAIAQECLGNYVLTHELGHCMGCQHNSEDGSALLSSAYWHGHRVPGQFRTVMSYPCEPDGLATCPRIPKFSAFGQNYVFNTFPLGTPKADNARLLRKTTPLVAKFKDPCPCSKEHIACRIAYKCCKDC